MTARLEYQQIGSAYKARSWAFLGGYGVGVAEWINRIVERIKRVLKGVLSFG